MQREIEEIRMDSVILSCEYEPPSKRSRDTVSVTDQLQCLLKSHISAQSNQLYSEIFTLQQRFSSDQQSQQEKDEEGYKESHLQDLLQSALSCTSHTGTLLSPDACLQCLHGVIQAGKDPLLSSKQRVELDVVLSHFKTIKSTQLSSWSEIVGHLMKEPMPIEVVWHLHTHNIVSLQTLFDSALRDRKQCSHLAEQLIRLCTGPKCGLINHKILSGVCCHLVRSGFPEKKSEDVTFRKICVSILDHVTRGLLDQHMSDGDLLLHTDLWRETADLPHISFKRFCVHTVSLIMSHQPNMKVSDALKRLKQWTSGKVPDNFRVLYKQLLVPFDSREVVEMLGRILEKQEVNWQTLLSFLATFLVCFPAAATDIQDHVSTLLRDSLEAGDMENTIVAFLLARQSCSEGPHVFPAYSKWFQDLFSDGVSSPAASKKAFAFLMKFLTELVPYEPADILKVHILRPPFVPAKCRDLWTDYTLLAKTRLADLKVPLEETNAAIYTDQRNTATPAEGSAQDVEKAVAVFESSGKLPITVMEASIFRKPYFVGKFLPALLQPRHLPDFPDSRMKFIEALKKAGKIPSSLFAKYEEACKRETRLLLEGVFEEEEVDGVEEMMMTPFEQLTRRLKQLTDTVISPSTESKVSEVVSIISEKTEAVLCPTSDGEIQGSPVCMVDLCQPVLRSMHVKVVDEVLNCVCRTVHAAPDVSQQSWLGQLVRMISQHAELLPALFTRLLTLFNNKSARLSSHHVEGVAAFVLHVASNVTLFPLLLVKQHSANESQDMSFMYHFLHSLPITTAKGMFETLRFLVEYLQFVFLGLNARWADCSDLSTVLPRRLIVMTCLLIWRIFPWTRHGQEQDLSWPRSRLTSEAGKKTAQESDLEHEESVLAALFASKSFQEVLKTTSPSLEEWVHLELGVDPTMDVLSTLQRQTYHHSMMSHFNRSLSSTSPPGSSNGSSRLQKSCSILMENLVKALSRSQLTAGQCSLCQQTVHVGGCAGLPNPHAVDHVLMLLSKLVQNVPVDNDTPSDEGEAPWLVTQVLQLYQQHAENEDTIVPEAVLRVVLSCPPHLLFSSCPGQGVGRKSMEGTVKLVEDFLVRCAAESGVLSLDVTCHLLQGYMVVAKDFKDREVQEMFENHPLIILSTLVHWQCLCALLPSLATSTPWDRLPRCLNMWDRVSIEELRRSLPLAETEPFCLAASMYSSLLHRNQSCTTEMRKEVFQYLHEQEPKTIHCLNTVLAVAVSDCAVCSASLQLKMEIHLRWLSELWGLFPYLIHLTFSTESQCSPLRRSLMSPDLETFTEVACLRCVCSLPAAAIACEGDVVTTVICLYARLCRRFEDDSSRQGTDVSLIMDVSKTVVTLLKVAPLGVLQALTEDDVKQCGLEAYGVYHQRLKNGQ